MSTASRLIPQTGNVWVTGYFVDDGRNAYTIIALLNTDLKLVKLLIYSVSDPYYIEKANAIGLGADGYVYVGGTGILKLDRSGNIVTVNRNVNVTKMLYVGREILAFSSSLMELDMHILDENLRLLSTVVVERNTSEWRFLAIGRPAFDGANVYFATYTMLFKNAQWVIYAITLPITQTVTITYTTLHVSPVTTTLTTTSVNTVIVTSTIATTVTTREITTARETIMSPITTTLTLVTPSPTTLTTTSVVTSRETTTVTATDWTTTGMVAVILLIVGVAIGYILERK